jgi:hypothetical protein
MFTRTVSVGPNASTPADSQWLRLDEWAGGQIGFQCVVSGTVVYNVETTFDDPNSPLNPVASPTWDSTLSGINGYALSVSGSIEAVPLYIKVNLTSGTGSVALTVSQSLSVPF